MVFGSDRETGNDDEVREGLWWVWGERAEVEGEEEELGIGQPGDEEGCDAGGEGVGEREGEEGEEREDWEEREEPELAFWDPGTDEVAVAQRGYDGEPHLD